MVKFIGEKPLKTHETDFAMDLVAESRELIIGDYGNYMVKYKVNLKTSILSLYGFKIIPRSSIVKTRLRLANSVGLVDSDYRGTWLVYFDIIGKIDEKILDKIKNGDDVKGVYNIGDRIAQTYISKKNNTEWKEVEKLDETKRNDGGFGSTGK